MEKIKAFFKDAKQPVLLTLVLMLVCGLIFPLVLTGISALIFPKEANGSLVEVDGKAVGSEFVGQEFTKPYFMKCRPSAVNYNTYTLNEKGEKVFSDGSEFTGVASGSQNLAPSNPALRERIKNDIEVFLEAHPNVKKEDIPNDLMTASGSGLDPHISPESAKIQIPEISQASGISEKALEEIIAENTTSKLLGIFGEETVNVLGVNIEISKLMNEMKK